MYYYMVVALRFAASILPQSDLNSSSVKSLVQQLIAAALSSSPVADNSGGTVHFQRRSSRARTSVVL
jgi:hypothetical protein